MQRVHGPLRGPFGPQPSRYHGPVHISWSGWGCNRGVQVRSKQAVN